MPDRGSCTPRAPTGPRRACCIALCAPLTTWATVQQGSLACTWKLQSGKGQVPATKRSARKVLAASENSCCVVCSCSRPCSRSVSKMACAHRALSASCTTAEPAAACHSRSPATGHSSALPSGHLCTGDGAGGRGVAWAISVCCQVGVRPKWSKLIWNHS